MKIFLVIVTVLVN